MLKYYSYNQFSSTALYNILWRGIQVLYSVSFCTAVSPSTALYNILWRGIQAVYSVSFCTAQSTPLGGPALFRQLQQDYFTQTLHAHRLYASPSASSSAFQLCLWGSLYLGGGGGLHIFLIQQQEVVPLPLCGWRLLGVFLLAGICIYTLTGKSF